MSKMRAHKSRAWLACVLALVNLAAHADPIARFDAKDLQITLHDTQCDLKSEITNLPRRAVWRQNGVDTEGCWGFSERFGLVLLYFKDKTATALPAPLFGKITAT